MSSPVEEKKPLLSSLYQGLANLGFGFIFRVLFSDLSLIHMDRWLSVLISSNNI